MSKEDAYDKHISPLMVKIIALCKKHKINMCAQFSLDHDEENGPLFCTTALHDIDPADADGVKRMTALRRVMYPSAQLFAFTITGGENP